MHMKVLKSTYESTFPQTGLWQNIYTCLPVFQHVDINHRVTV